MKNPYRHIHKITHKIWSDEQRKFLIGKFCLACGKDMRTKKEQFAET